MALYDLSRVWNRQKDEAIRKIGYSIDEWIDELAVTAIDDYRDSTQFEKDACEYCREQGWREPEEEEKRKDEKL